MVSNNFIFVSSNDNLQIIFLLLFVLIFKMFFDNKHLIIWQTQHLILIKMCFRKKGESLINTMVSSNTLHLRKTTVSSVSKIKLLKIIVNFHHIHLFIILKT